MLRRGSFTIRIERFSAGSDLYHDRSEIAQQGHAILKNLRPDGDVLKLRYGSTGIPQGTHIGAAATAGAKGLYIWRPDEGGRHIMAAYNRAASAYVSLYEIHTTGATALGFNLATTSRIGMCGFGGNLYVADGRNRMLYTDGVRTGGAPFVDQPMAGFHTSVGAPYAYAPNVYDEYADPLYPIGTAGWVAHPAHFPSYYMMIHTETTPFPSSLKQLWPPVGTGLLASARSCSVPGSREGYGLHVRVQGSCVPGAYAHYVYTGSRATAGSWRSVGGIQFWVKQSKAGQFMELRLGPDSSVPMRLPITINQADTWEHKELDVSGWDDHSRSYLASARLVVLETGSTFAMYLGPLSRDGLQRGIYHYAPAFYRSSDDVESPLAYYAVVSTKEASPPAHGFYLPPRSSIDTTIDAVKWYRRGGASAEWREVAMVGTGVAGYDTFGDHEGGNLSPNVPGPAPRSNLLVRFSEARMMALGGYDYGDYAAPIPYSSTQLATSAWTAMTRVTVPGLSRGVDVYMPTSSTTTAFRVKLQKKVSGTFATQRQTDVWGRPASPIASGWRTLLWTSTMAAKDSQVTIGSATWQMVFSAVGTAGAKFGCGKAAKPAYYHILDYSDRVWVSRRFHPTWFDRLTALKALDDQGWHFDLPHGGREAINAHGTHGSDHLIWSKAGTFLLRGQSAADASCMRISAEVNCVSHETVAEERNWTFWVGGRTTTVAKSGSLKRYATGKADLDVYAFGPEIEAAVSEPGKTRDGIFSVGLAIAPLLNLVSNPTRMCATGARGRYELSFGEVVTWQGEKYTGASFDLDTRSWTLMYQNETTVRPPRFMATLSETGDILQASPASGTAGTSTNRLWWFDYDGVVKDGAQALSYVYETRHSRVPDSYTSKLRGYGIYVDQATSGPMTINAYANGQTAGTLTHSLAAAGAGMIALTNRFGPKAAGDHVGLRLSGTASTSVLIHSINLFLDRKR